MWSDSCGPPGPAGRPRNVLAVHPIGALFVSLSLLLLARAAVGCITGGWITPHLPVSRTEMLTLVVVGLLLVPALEAKQQMHSALLVGPV